MIKSIVVATKPFNFNTGDVLYSGCEKFLNKHVVTGVPFKSESGAWKIPVETTLLGTTRRDHGTIYRNYGSVVSDDFIFLGDEGVPGYAYDKRPCTLARSAEAAYTATRKFRVWSENREKSPVSHRPFFF